MKRYIKTILSVITIVCIVLSVAVFNVSAASVNVGGAGEYEVGKSFSVTISFNADATLFAVQADVSYNSSVLRLNSVSGGDYNVVNGGVKIVDDAFTATKPSKTSSYTLNFTAIAAGNSNITVSVLGGGEAESKASGSAAITVVTPKPSSNANLSSIKLSNGSLSPAFNPNTLNYSATVKYGIESITITGAVADGKATYTGGGTFGLEVGDNSRVLTVTAEDGTKKSYTVNIKRMTEQETAEAEAAERDANPTLVTIDNADYTIVNDFTNVVIPAGFAQGTTTRKDAEITILNDDHGEYVLYWLVDAAGENGSFYTRDENDKFTRVNYVISNNKMYIIEEPDIKGYVPETYIKADRDIDGAKVKVYNFADKELKDFCIVKCYVGGARAYYRLDTVEGTMQRAVDFDLAIKQASSESEEQKDQTNTGKLAWFKNMNKTGKAVFLLIVLIAIILIVAAVLVVVRIVSSNVKDYEDDFVPIENDDFVLNDFSTESEKDENKSL